MNPKFGKIFDLITFENNSRLVLCVVEYYGHVFMSHYNSYLIKSKGTITAVDVFALSDHRPLLAYHNFNASDHSNLHIILPYYY